MLGDFNFHIDDDTNYDTQRFWNFLESFCLIQHVTRSTNKNGQILDLIITRSSEDIVSEVRVHPSQIISDHSAIHFKIHVTKPGPIKKEITFRKLRTLDIKVLCNDIQESSLICNMLKKLPELVEQYNNILHPQAPWYNESICNEKQLRRKLEKRS